jgi:acyl dehydratase
MNKITTTLADLPKYEGEIIGPSDWVEITQERVNKFAEATSDFQWIHVDVERAENEIGGTIAHGFLTLALIPFLSHGFLDIIDSSRGMNYGVENVRFTNPIKVGKRIRAITKIIEARKRVKMYQITLETTIEIEGEKRPACVATTIGIAFPNEE